MGVLAPLSRLTFVEEKRGGSLDVHVEHRQAVFVAVQRVERHRRRAPRVPRHQARKRRSVLRKGRRHARRRVVARGARGPPEVFPRRQVQSHVGAAAHPPLPPEPAAARLVLLAHALVPGPGQRKGRRAATAVAGGVQGGLGRGEGGAVPRGGEEVEVLGFLGCERVRVEDAALRHLFEQKKRETKEGWGL